MKRIVAFFAVALVLAAVSARADDLAPSLITPKKQTEDPRIEEQTQSALERLKTILEKMKDATGGKVDPNNIDIGKLKDYGLKGPKLSDLLQTAFNLMQEYGIIDPKEKSVQPELNPPGQPVLPSRAVKDPNLTPDQYGDFRSIQKKIDLARNFLEKNYVILRATEIHAKRLTELANSAANISGIAGLVWATAQANPSDPMNKSKTAFYAKYDQAQANGLKYLNDTLKKMAEFERKNYRDPNWYVYYGLPYYNFMFARYTRPGAGAKP